MALTYLQNRKLDEIIKTYGADKQIDVAIEEMAELTKALLKDRRDSKSRADIIDEVADVSVMIEQLIIMYGIAGEVAERIDFKINRQIERIEQL